jgi:hypothetical protein
MTFNSGSVGCLRLFEAACDARIAGQIELDPGIFMMQLACSQKNRFCLLNALRATRRIRKAYPPACFLGPDLHQMIATAAAMSHFLAVM